MNMNQNYFPHDDLQTNEQYYQRNRDLKQPVNKINNLNPNPNPNSNPNNQMQTMIINSKPIIKEYKTMQSLKTIENQNIRSQPKRTIFLHDVRPSWLFHI
jgi:hypothetical protein